MSTNKQDGRGERGSDRRKRREKRVSQEMWTDGTGKTYTDIAMDTNTGRQDDPETGTSPLFSVLRSV